MNDNDGIKEIHVFYSKYYRILVLYAIKIVADTALPEDIVQAAFTKMLENKADFHHELSARAYIYTAVHHLCLDTLKHQSVVNGFHLSPDAFVSPPDEETMDRNEVWRRVLEKIDSMPPRQREVFLLLMEGNKVKDIAKMMNVSENTVKMQKKRGLSALRQQLSDKDFSFVLLTL
jgi:RNA polymerase sigma-70 factor (ECF subfamily)